MAMIILDIEATGTEYDKHSIVSLGAIEYENPTNQFYEECRIWEGAHIMDEALAVCGFTREEVTDSSKQTEVELIKAFVAWSEEIAERTLAGQNVSFDRDYVKAACKRAHIDNDFAHRTLDTHTLAWMHMVKAGKQIGRAHV